MSQRTCPKCRALLSRADRVCPYCEYELAPPLPPIGRRPGTGSLLPQIIPDSHTTTFLLLMMNVGMFAAAILYAGPESMSMEGFDGNVLTKLGAMSGLHMYYRGEWWRLITAGFLHGNIVHIMMNTLALYQLGNEVEEFFEAPRYFAIYVFSTITGYYASYLWGNFLSVGASAGIFGLLGALVAYAVLKGSYSDKEYYTRLAIYLFLLGVLLSLAPIGRWGRTDNAAHFGGMVGGFAIAWLAGLPRAVPDWRERVWQGVGWLSIALVVLSYVTWARSGVL